MHAALLKFIDDNLSVYDHPDEEKIINDNCVSLIWRNSTSTIMLTLAADNISATGCVVIGNNITKKSKGKNFLLVHGLPDMIKNELKIKIN